MAVFQVELLTDFLVKFLEKSLEKNLLKLMKEFMFKRLEDQSGGWEVVWGSFMRDFQSTGCMA